MYHNASEYSTPSPIYTTPLYFNTSIFIAFECIYETIYSSTTTIKWYVNDIDTYREGRYFDRYFEEGNYTDTVTCVASYPVPGCQPCNRTASIPVTVEGTTVRLLVCRWKEKLWQLLKQSAHVKQKKINSR